jgi:hypothetical protein
VLTSHGKIYCVTWDATGMMIIDPVTNTADTTTINALTGTSKWHGGEQTLEDGHSARLVHHLRDRGELGR